MWIAVVVATVILMSTIALLQARQRSESRASAAPLSETLAALQASYRGTAYRAINAEEDAVAEIQQTLLDPWADALRDRQAEAFAKLLAPAAAMQDWLTPRRAPRAVGGMVALEAWAPSHVVRGTGALQAMMEGYVRQFEHIEAVAFDVQDAQLPHPGGAILGIHFDVRGRSRDGQRRQDRGLLRLTCERFGEGWRLTGANLDGAETLLAAAPAFVDATAASGLDAVPVQQRLEAIRRGGYALAVGDVDGDGRPDLYVGTHGPGHLYHARADGRYEDVTAASGLAADTLVKAAAIVDVDNDGAKDLVLTRFVTDDQEDVVVYRNDGRGHFQRVPGAVARGQRYDRAMPLTVGDFNGDGLLDLYVGFPGARDFTAMDFQPQRLASQGIFLNRGGAHFEDRTLSLLAQRGQADVGLFPHAAITGDWNGDGSQDLLVVDDRRDRSPVYRNDGHGGLTDLSTEMGIQNAGWGMGVAVGDFDGDGLPDVYLTNIDFLAARRIARFLPPEQRLFTGNRLFRNLGNGHFEDVTARAGLGWAGEAAGGAVWVDYDNDGRPDLYVVNGLWTGPGRRDLESAFVRAFVARKAQSATPALASRVASDAAPAPSGMEEKSAVMRLLAEYRGADATAPPLFSMAGRQRNCLFHNNGDGTFTEVGYLANADRVEDGYVAAVMDYDGDGRPDLVLRNADPGTLQHTYPAVVLLRNVGSAGRSLTVRLRGDGQRSNRDAIGASVTVWSGGRRQSRTVQSLSGASQSDTALVFGLGSAATVDRMTVCWPSGRVEEMRGLPCGRVLVTEGSGWRAQ